MQAPKPAAAPPAAAAPAFGPQVGAYGAPGYGGEVATGPAQPLARPVSAHGAGRGAALPAVLQMFNALRTTMMNTPLYVLGFGRLPANQNAVGTLT
jgi:hypothetical protein